jgi:hypothetical protein
MAGGYLIGATAGGGSTVNDGTIFQLIHTKAGWTYKTLHSFAGGPSDGATPNGGLIFDAKYNLYGTTRSGGTGYGTVFSITP